MGTHSSVFADRVNGYTQVYVIKGRFILSQYNIKQFVSAAR